MHDGCSGSFEDGRQVVEKVRLMGFSTQQVPVPLQVRCGECGSDFSMETFEALCPSCAAVHGVTPCHAFDPDNVVSAGVGF